MTSLKHATTAASAAAFHFSLFVGKCFAQLGEAEDLTEQSTGDLEGDITGVVQKILTYVAIIAVIVIIIAGLRMIISSGDDQAVEKSKKTLLWAVAGLIVIIISAGIVNIVLG